MSRELPILYTTSNVQAIQAGRKDMTRRAMNPQPPLGYDAPILITETEWGFRKPTQGHMPFFAKPRYQVGDVLWVKETYADLGNDTILYKADWTAQELADDGGVVPWKSGRFMFKKYARLWLEVTAVKAERLCEISEEDAEREGCTVMVGVTALGNMGLASARYSFKRLWDSINGAGSWDSNPWVWAYTFKRIER